MSGGSQFSLMFNVSWQEKLKLELTLMPVCCVPSGVPANVSDGYVYNRTFCYQTGENNMPSVMLHFLSVVTFLVLTLFPFSIRCSR